MYMYRGGGAQTSSQKAPQSAVIPGFIQTGLWLTSAGTEQRWENTAQLTSPVSFTQHLGFPHNNVSKESCSVSMWMAEKAERLSIFFCSTGSMYMLKRKEEDFTGKEQSTCGMFCFSFPDEPSRLFVVHAVPLWVVWAERNKQTWVKKWRVFKFTYFFIVNNLMPRETKTASAPKLLQRFFF